MPILAGLRLAKRLDKQVHIEWFGKLAVETLPNDVVGYRSLAKIHIEGGNPTSAIRLLREAPKGVRRTTPIVMLLERALRDANDHLGAHSVLMIAQRDHPLEPRVLTKLSHLYKDDAQPERALHLLLAAESLGQDETVRRVVIEASGNNAVAGRQSLLKLITKSRGTGLVRATSVVNEFAHCYPDLTKDIATFRAVVRDAVQCGTGGLTSADRLQLALSCRMIDEAHCIYNDAAKRGLSLPRRIKSLYHAVREQSDCLGLLAKLACANENVDGRRLLGLAEGRSMVIDGEEYDPDRVVEVFIPWVFYSDPEREKQAACARIRRVFQVLVSRLSQKQDIVLVPRHLFNHRMCRPLLRGRTLSYHTRGAGDRRHLRVKEGALLGYTTLDHRGYAGFASVATDFEQIRRAVENVSRDALYENRAALYSELVVTGKSKYAQPISNARIVGRYVFVALQVLTDEVAELAWVPAIELMNQVARLYSGTGIAVVVKRHPFCKSFSVQAAMLELEAKGMIIASTGSVHSLISGAEVVFTVNSGVGLEALIHGRPVIVSGLCDYAYGAVCIRSAEELGAAIAEARRDDMKALEFLYFYVNHHAFKVSEAGRLESRVDEWLGCPVAAEVDGEANPQPKSTLVSCGRGNA